MKQVIKPLLTFFLLASMLFSVNVQAQGVVDDQTEFLALKALYDSLGGSAWTTKTNWPAAGNWPASATSAQFKTWYGVTVTNGDVTSLSFGKDNMIGVIPAALGGLTQLITFSLSSNTGITGSVPSWLSSISSLQTITLASDSLSGAIPGAIFSLPHIKTITLNNNKLTGTIPSVPMNATSLTTISLVTNQLTGTIPSSIGNAASLTSLNFSYNQLTGNIPSSIGNLSKLTTLYLNNNQLTDSIPSSIFNLAHLNTLYLNVNQLSGSIPANIGNATSLVTLTLCSNQLTGPIPVSIGNLSNVVTLNLYTNRLTGQIPRTIGELTKLQVLDLSTNQLTGVLPSELSNCTSLTRVYLYTNQLTGLETLGVLPNLTILEVNSNNISGPVPNWIWQMPALTTLYLSNNQFSGNLPPIVGPTNLVSFQAATNQLTGGLPDPTNLQKLTYLAISHNNMSGPIPVGYSALNFSTLDISYNNFDGVLPDNLFAGSSNLFDLYLEYNSFSGAFPSSIATCAKVAAIYGYNNQFSSIPASILNLPVATSIRFSTNNLTSIPNFANHVNKANLTLQIASNLLDFSQLEPLIGVGIHSLTYIPQLTIQDVSSIQYHLNETLAIPARAPGQHSTITWQKQQSSGTWTTVNSSNNDNTQQTFTQNNVQIGSEGIYKWSMTNTQVTGLTLSSAPITVTTTKRLALNQWGFQYQYDGRRRMIAKRVPGVSDWTYMVYDTRDRLVMTQDAAQRPNKQWTVTKYDSLNRPVITAIYTHTAIITQAAMAALISTNKFCEYYVGSAAASNHGYSLQVWPKTSTTLTVLTVDYYDNYNFINDLTVFGSGYNYVHTDITGQEALNNTMVVGKPTGAKTNVLGTTSYLKTVTYYDQKYRVVQAIADNNKGGYDRATNVVDFVGRILNTLTTHHTTTPDIHTETVAHRIVYDHASRVKQVFHAVNTNPEVLLVQNSYNEIGQLVEKNLHSIDGGSTFKQSIDLRYNIRGWLTNINGSDLSTQGIGGSISTMPDLFGMDLLYDQPDAGLNNQAQFNGNISAVKWSTNMSLGATKSVAYNFAYDTMNRIKSAAYLTNSGLWSSSLNFAESGFTYDLNGNIKNLTRTNAKGTTTDNLTYDYTGQGNAGNQLHSVTDVADIQNGFADGNVNGDDYIYDANGNMTADKNKNITAITYNYLNLPQQVTKATGEKIVYTYDASGRKLTQQVYNSSSMLQKTTEYDGDFIYHYAGNGQSDTLQFINHQEGRVVMTGTSPEYQYHLKDHLGNVRLTFTSSPTKDANIATLEPTNQNAEQSKFLRMNDARIVNSTIFDHTHNGISAASERLSGSANEKAGIARSVSVMPGDTIQIEVYGKYVDGNNSTNTAALTQFLSQVLSGTATAGTVIDGANYSTNGITQFPYTGLAGEGNDSGDGPKAYLNYLVFDRNFVLVNAGFVRLTSAAKEDGTTVSVVNPYGNIHEKLSAQVQITQPGYVYTYLSNENTTPVEVYFDDFKMTQIKSPVVQMEDYYPFGLSFNSYSRENTVPQNFQYNGKELQNDLSLNWLDYGARMYMPEIGRWGVMDPLAENFMSLSPYAYALNNPISFVDIEGLMPGDPRYTGSGNVVIIIADNPKDSWNTSTLDNTKWDYGVFQTVSEARQWMNDTYGKNGVGVNNIVFRSHGGVGEDEFDSGIALGVNSPNEDWLEARDFGGGSNNKNAADIIAIASYLKENGNMLFTACGISQKGTALANSIFRAINGAKKSLTVYTNGTSTKLAWSGNSKIKVNHQLNEKEKNPFKPWYSTTNAGSSPMRSVPGLGLNGFMFFSSSSSSSSSAPRNKKKKDADKEAAKRSGGW